MNKYKVITMIGNEHYINAEDICTACKIFERANLFAGIHSIFTVSCGVDE